jgi:F420H(2)-dependent quinone reductase
MTEPFVCPTENGSFCRCPTVAATTSPRGIGAEVTDMTARDATDDERRLYWRKVTRIYPPYKGYQDAADRRIPLVVCELI